MFNALSDSGKPVGCPTQTGFPIKREAVAVQDNIVLEARGLSKSFYGNDVLKKINFNCTSGEIHALVGENGAGKSTLMRIFSGVQQPSSGELYLNGQAVKFSNTLQAQNAGVGIIHQEFNLVSKLSVSENIFLGRQRKKKNGNIDYKWQQERTRQLCEKMHIKIEPDELVGHLTVAQQQMVEIIKTIELDTQIIIMDEPTAALTTVEIEFLFSVMKELREEGKTVIYISHRLDEVFEISDRITVLKDGVMVATLKTSETNRDQIVGLMVGRELGHIFPPRDQFRPGAPILEVKNLLVDPKKAPANFMLRKGEVLGITGLEGQGQREILRSLFGLNRPLSGEIKIDGEMVDIKNPRVAMDRGLTFLTDDRKMEGLCLELPIFRNICLPIMNRLKKGGILLRRSEEQAARPYMELMNIKAEGLSQTVQSLSGGNQQKVLLSKCLSPSPEILLVHEPTRGIDVAAKIEIYTLMKKLTREQNLSIVMVSSDLLEVLHVSDRILVIYNGGVNAELLPEDATEEIVMRYATNLERGNKNDFENVC